MIRVSIKPGAIQEVTSEHAPSCFGLFNAVMQAIFDQGGLCLSVSLMTHAIRE